MDDVIKLVTATYEYDEYGNETPTRTMRQVFCRISSVGRSEYYQAAQAGLHPEYICRLSNYRDYNGELEAVYTDYTGTEKRFDIIRTYKHPDSDELDITIQERIADE